MRLIRLELYNFGIYRGLNSFVFGDQKPVVLIGGMNGRGKTTFLEAVLAALYGANSIAYKESGYSTFGQYLRAHTNTDSDQLAAYIELEFENTRDGVSECLTVRREWDVARKHVFVETTVARNGMHDAFLTENWAAYIEDILPHALSGFFFFDGEKIAELAIEDSDSQIRESIRSILGVSTVDVLRRDLKTICKRLGKAKSSETLAADLEASANEVDALKEKLALIDDEIAELIKSDAALEKSLEIMRSQYISVGGEAMANRAAHEERKKHIIERIKENDERGVALSASNAPLVMFSDILPSLLKAAEADYNKSVMTEALHHLEEALASYEGNVTDVMEFLEYVKKTYPEEGKQNPCGVTAKGLAELAHVVREIPSLCAEYKSYVDRKTALELQLNETEDFLSVAIDETAVKDIGIALDQTAKKIAEIRASLSSREEERTSINGEYIRKNAEYKRVMRRYLEDLNELEDDSRALKYAHIADEIFDRYSIKIQEKKVAKLAATISDCYKILANKKSMISKISMDPITLEVIYLGPSGDPIESQLLSAGEKQLMVIAILWALAKCSDKKLPVIIDTPLARLDSSHRLAVVSSYFPNASDQTIILSTDSEIFGEYYEALKPSISDEFTLVYSDETRSTSIQRGYFMEAAQ